MKKTRPKHLDLDDIGYIGDGRLIIEQETRLASEHIQAYKAKYPSPKRKSAKRGTTDKRMCDAVKALPKKATGADAKLKSLDDIGFIGGGPPPTEEDFRAIPAFIKARKAKRASTRKAVAKRAAKRVPAKRSSKEKAGS